MPQRIERFDNVVLRRLRPKIDEALERLGQEFGIKFHAGNASYQAKECTFKLKITLLDETGAVVDLEAEAFKTYARMYGFNPTDLGREFTHNERTYRIAGLSARSRKYPILGDDVRTGARFKFMPEGIRRQFDRQNGTVSRPPVGLVTRSPEELMSIGSSDVADLSIILEPSTPAVQPTGKRSYLPLLKELVEEGRWTAKELVLKIMAGCPTATKASVQTVVTDLKNPKYCAFKPLEVMVGEGGVLYFASTSEA